MTISYLETQNPTAQAPERLQMRVRGLIIFSAMDNRPVAFIDSGVGGLPYLKWVKQHLPLEKFIYIADNANFPYGPRDREELQLLLEGLVQRLVEKHDPKLIVIACNTASVTALAYLRDKFSMPFVGTVPAVKTAALKTVNKKIGLMATDRTLNDVYTEALIRDHASECEIFRYSGTEIIDFIEKRLYEASEDEKEKVLRPAIEFFSENNADKIVLGCTHFLLMETELRKYACGSIEIIDSREGVGNQIIRVLKNNDLLSQMKTGEDLFILTDRSGTSEKIRNSTWILEEYGLCAE